MNMLTATANLPATATNTDHHQTHHQSQQIQHIGQTIEDERAFQLALELTMLCLNSKPEQELDGDFRVNKKSQNTTECVPVPSSEHVAEIVGRQGCKIKGLRAKTNTYIKTPVRGEEPVFVVTGRKEDVNAAKNEILSAAEHFTHIRLQRKNNINGVSLGAAGTPGQQGVINQLPGQTTIQVRVPYRVVGLVVGPKGATIKRIQQATNTYIITPSREKEPVFEVTGLPDNVDNARKEIEAHIALRTGGLMDSSTRL
jgi:RNA-binding protein MEX3